MRGGRRNAVCRREGCNVDLVGEIADMKATPRKLINGFLNGGVPWLALTARNEFYNPRRSLTLGCRRVLAKAMTYADALRKMVGGDAAAGHRLFDKTLVFCLDLDASPVTFDVASYLAGAEVMRRKLGLKDIYVVIVPGRHNGFRVEDSEYDSVVDVDSRSWRVENIVLPLLFLLPSVSGFQVCRSRDDAAFVVRNARHVFPDTYLPSMPRQPAERLVRDAGRSREAIWPLFRATPKALQYARKVLDSYGGCPRPVVISLRQYDHMSQRNSELLVWRGFAQAIKSSGFTPIFLIDMEANAAGPLAELKDEIVLGAAFWNLSLRMALYELAWLNMAIMHGPMELCWYNEKCRYVVFIPVGAAPQCSPEALHEQGHEIGIDFPFAKPYQRLVWEADTTEAVNREFAAMRPIIEQLDRRAE
jgi:hypothetical protein